MSAIAHFGKATARRPLHRLAATVLGGTAAWLATGSLPPVPSAVLLSLLLAGGASKVGAPLVSAPGTWLLSGAAAGGLLGTASS
ncbi:MAG: hypothetical protein ACKOZW_01450, partial [Cyanobium sp.]